MKPFRTIAIAALAAGVAGSAVTAFAQGGGDWAGGAQMHGKGPMGWHKGGKGPGRGAKHMFEKFDQNGDGVITQDEVNAVIEARFKAADKDGNGSVTLDEFSEAALAESKPMQVRMFQRLDRDGDGTVTTEEFNKATDRMFSRLDRDGDGFLAPAPRDEAGKDKPAKDQDGDRDGKGRRDRDGMMPGMGHGMGHGMGPGHGMGMGPMGGGMFALLAQFDTDQDGKVSREEFDAGRAKFFALADTDGSGGFSLQDFPAIWLEVTKPHTVRMFQRLDQDGDLGLTQEEMAGPMANFVEDMDRNGDGVVTKADFRHGKRHGKDGRDGDRGGRHGERHGDRHGERHGDRGGEGRHGKGMWFHGGGEPDQDN